MSFHTDKQMQHDTRNGLQRSTRNTYTFRKTAHPQVSGGYQGWEETKVADTLNIYDNSEMRTPIVVVQETKTATSGTPTLITRGSCAVAVPVKRGKE